MHFGLAIELSDIDLWDIDSLDTHLDSLDTNIPSKYLVCLYSVFKTSSRYALETSSRHVFKLSSRQVFRTPSRHVFKTSSRHVFKTSSRHVFKTSWRRLGDKQNVYWGYLYLTNLNVYLTNLCFTNLYLTNLRRIQNASLRTQ